MAGIVMFRGSMTWVWQNYRLVNIQATCYVAILEGIQITSEIFRKVVFLAPKNGFFWELFARYVMADVEL